MSTLKTMFHSFRIRSEPEDPTIHHVFMDGEEVHGVTKAIVIYRPRELPEVLLQMGTMNVDIDTSHAEVHETFKVFVPGEIDDPFGDDGDETGIDPV